MNISETASSLNGKLFTLMDLSRIANTDEEKDNVGRFIQKINAKVVGLSVLCDESEIYINYSNQLSDVILNLKGIESVSDFTVRKSILHECIGILDKIAKNN
jgi:hypothetical protein